MGSGSRRRPSAEGSTGGSGERFSWPESHRRTTSRLTQQSPDEYGHQLFYDRLGYVYTYSGHVGAGDEDPYSSPEARRRFFLDVAGAHLEHGRNLVICPEGAWTSTERSPLRLRPGAFRLVAHVRPEPLLVPVAVAVANFEKS
jgi:hypothetical protein